MRLFASRLCGQYCAFLLTPRLQYGIAADFDSILTVIPAGSGAFGDKVRYIVGDR
jgi:hypothetical protein